MKRFFLNYWPIIFIIAVWLVFASPYFFKGLVPYASNYQVNFFAPWSHYQKFWGPIKNNAMPDVHTQIYPWKKLTIDIWKQGQIPLWNPYSFSGNPHLANFQSAALSPFNIPFFIFPFIDSWSIVVLLAPLLAGLFTYFLMRSFAVSKSGSVISGMSFMFCGFIVVWMAYGTLAMASAFLPLTIYAMQKSFQKNAVYPLLLLSLSLPLSIFSGHFQTSLYVIIFAFSFLVYKALLTKAKNRAFMASIFFIFGLLLSMPQILPSIEFYLNSVRSGIFIEGGGIPLYYLVNIFSPDFFGNPVTRNDWAGFYAEWASFIGIIPLILAFFAVSYKRISLYYFFFIAGLIVLLLAVDSPIQKLIGMLKIPVFSTSNPSRVIFLFSFSFAILAGFGLDIFRERVLQRNFKNIFTILTIAGIFLITIWILLLVGKIMPYDKLVIAKRNLLLPTGFFVGNFLMIILAKRYKNFLIVAIFYLMLATSFDSFRFAQKWMPFDPKNLVYPQIPLITFLKENMGIGRVYGNLGGEVTTYYSLGSIEGYDPLYINSYGDFLRTANSGKFSKGERSVVKLDRRGEHVDRILDLLGVSYVFHPKADTDQVWAYPIWEKKDKYMLAYQDDRLQLFKNVTAMPRVGLFYAYDYEIDRKKILERFYKKDFDFRKMLILEENPKITLAGKQSSGNAQVTSYTPNKISINASTNFPALLFISDNYYPGWKAFVDGKETQIYRANYTFRAITLNKGSHNIEFVYDPLSFRLGAYIAIAGVVGIFGTIILLKKKHNA